MSEKKLEDKTFSVTTTVNIGNYQNVKVMVSRTDEKEDFESIKNDVLEASVTHIPEVVDKISNLIEEL